MADAAPLLQLRKVEKTFPNGTIALRGVDFDAYAGRVHGLLGANGAGKSTLIKILSGAVTASAGTISWRGEAKNFASPAEANAIGIATIHQHIPLAPTLSVLENIFLGGRGFWRRSQADRIRFAALCEEVGYQIDPDVLVSELPIGRRQMVAIMQALGGGADLIVMDEPTASLANEEREIVYQTVRRLSRQGKGIIFVSHFLDEVVALTDEVTVLRDGREAMRANTRDVDEQTIAEAIVGKAVATLDHLRHDREPPPDDVVLDVRNLASGEKLKRTHLVVRRGEVLGVAGLLGSGRSELLHAIFGADRHATGEVFLDGASLPRSTAAAVKAGVALVPEDRKAQGLIPAFEIWRNITLPHLDETAIGGLLTRRGVELARGQAAIDKLRIKAPSPETLVTELSGGNAQKVTVAKWLFGQVKLLLLDEPTAGIDVGAKADILALTRQLAAAGVAIVIVSSEFEELLAVADRILVMRDGAIIAECEAASTSEHELVLLAGGSSEAPPTLAAASFH
jgi:ribose transport system ATP-binding protein